MSSLSTQAESVSNGCVTNNHKHSVAYHGKHLLVLLMHLWVGWDVADVGWAQLGLTPGCVLSPGSAPYVSASLDQ